MPGFVLLQKGVSVSVSICLCPIETTRMNSAQPCWTVNTCIIQMTMYSVGLPMDQLCHLMLEFILFDNLKHFSAIYSQSIQVFQMCN